MKVHKEGLSFLWYTLIVILVSLAGGYFWSSFHGLWGVLGTIGVICLLLFLWFFRNPKRGMEPVDHTVYAPADGQIVVVEQTFEYEYLKRDCIQVSIFMSPLDVHVNRYPISGTIRYVHHHLGGHKIANLPKSSHYNERTTVVIAADDGTEIVMRQIAGAMARRIVCYAQVGDKVTQGNDLGFIKFGSRVDLFLPLTADIQVDLEQKVRGNKTPIAILE